MNGSDAYVSTGATSASGEPDLTVTVEDEQSDRLAVHAPVEITPMFGVVAASQSHRGWTIATGLGPYVVRTRCDGRVADAFPQVTQRGPGVGPEAAQRQPVGPLGKLTSA
jgi:hypothetical protein